MATCKFCGVKFAPQAKSERYCSDACKYLNKRVRKWERLKTKQDGGSKDGRKWTLPATRDEVIEFLTKEHTCPVCGTSYVARCVTQRCCSPKCSNILYKRGKRAESNPPLESVRCTICGKEFKPDRRTQRICSAECRNKKDVMRLRAYKKSKDTRPLHEQIRVCKICGKEFTPTSAGQKCCSVECSGKNLQELERARQKGRGGHRGGGRCRNSSKGPAGVEVKCQFCGKTFVSYNSRTKFCSDVCRYKRDQFEREHRYRELHSSRVCLECGKEFQPQYKDQVCCSVNCRMLRRYKWHRKETYPKIKTGESAMRQSRRILMERVQSKNEQSIVGFERILKLPPDELRKACEDMSKTEKMEFYRFYKNKYQITAGRKLRDLFRLRKEGEMTEYDKLVDAVRNRRTYTPESQKKKVVN